jgi:hypothetical protein
MVVSIINVLNLRERERERGYNCYIKWYRSDKARIIMARFEIGEL